MFEGEERRGRWNIEVEKGLEGGKMVSKREEKDVREKREKRV